MLGELAGIPIGALTPAALLGILVLLIALGKLVPRRTMEDTIHDRDEWRTAHRISEQSRVELAGMVGELLEHARTTDAFIRSLPHPHGPTPPPSGISVEVLAQQVARRAAEAQRRAAEAHPELGSGGRSPDG